MLNWQQNTPSYDSEEKYEKEYGTWDKTQANFQLMFKQVFLQSWATEYDIKQRQTIYEKMSPEKVKEQFGFLPDRPLTPGAADYIKKERDEILQLEHISNNGPRTFWGGTAVPFLFGTLPGAVADPVEMLAGMFLGMGLGKVATLAKGAYKASKLTGKIGTVAIKSDDIGKIGKLAIDALANTSVNVAAEVQNISAIKATQREVVPEQMLKNIIIGSLGFTAAIHGLSGVVGRLSKAGATNPLSETADMYIKNGKPVNSINRIIDRLDADLKIDETFKSSTVRIYGEKSEKWFDGAESVLDIKEKMALEDEGLYTRFLDDLEQNGYEMRKTYAMGGEPHPRLPDEDIQSITDDLTHPETDFGYNKKADEVLNKPIIEVKVDQEVAEQYSKLKQFEKESLPDEDFVRRGKEIEVAEAKHKQTVEAQQTYLECIGMAL